MIPHYDEFLDACSERVAQSCEKRFLPIEESEKNFLDMDENDLLPIFKRSKHTNIITKSLLISLVNFLKDEHENTININYVVKNLEFAFPKHIYVSNLEELYSLISKAEDKYISEVQSEISYLKMNSLLFDQAKYELFVLFLWKNINYNEMLKIKKTDVSEKNHTVYLSVSDEYIKFSDDEWNIYLKIRDKLMSHYRNKNDGILETNSKKVMLNLPYLSIGSHCLNKINLKNIQKAARFNAMREYEMKTGVAFDGGNGNIMEINNVIRCNLSESRLRALLLEYIDMYS